MAPCSTSSRLSSVGVGEVAVVGDGERAAAGVDAAGLRVGEHGAAGGGVAGVADRDVAGEPARIGVVEVLGDEPHAAVRAGVALPVHRHDPGALLPPVLQGVEAEVGEPGRVGDAGDADDAAHAVYSPTERSASACCIRRGIASK